MYGRYLFITPLCIIHLFKNVWQLGAPCLITPRMARARWSRPLAPPVTWRGGCRRLAGLTPDLPRTQPKLTPPAPPPPPNAGQSRAGAEPESAFRGGCQGPAVPRCSVSLGGGAWGCHPPAPRHCFLGLGDAPCLPPGWPWPLSPVATRPQHEDEVADVQGGWQWAGKKRRKKKAEKGEN